MATPSYTYEDTHSRTPLELLTQRHGHGFDPRTYSLCLIAQLGTSYRAGGAVYDTQVFTATDCMRLATVDDFGNLRPASVQ